MSNLPDTKPSRELLANPGSLRTGEGTEFIVEGGATRLYSAMAVRKSIQLYVRTGIIMTRGMTIGKLLKSASNFTGRKYSSSKKTEAIDDLTAWIDAAAKIVNGNAKKIENHLDEASR